MKYVLGIDVNVSITNIISKGGGSVDIYWSIIIFVEVILTFAIIIHCFEYLKKIFLFPH